LFRDGRYSEGPPIKLVWIWDVWGSGWPLLKGGRYSEVAVSTGLTVLTKAFFTFKITVTTLTKTQKQNPIEPDK
jgi:hypothetical protein